MKKETLIIFIIAFSYISFFTNGVPIFFEDRQAMADQVQQTGSNWVKKVFLPGSENPLVSMGEMPGLLMWTLNKLFGFNESAHRIIKGLFFAGVISLTYLLASRIMRKKNAFLCTAIILFSFSHFLQTFIYYELLIYAELFKIGLIILLLNDLRLPQLKRLPALFALAVMSFRFYHPAMSTVGILGLIFLKTRKIRYAIITAAVLVFVIPRNGASLVNPEYSPKLNIINQFFVSGAWKTITTYPHITNLYHRPFWDVITPAGIIFVLFVITIAVAYKLKWTKEAQLILIWAAAELPLYVFLPEPAIRYAASILTPFILLTFYFFDAGCQHMKPKHQKLLSVAAYTVIIIIVITNLAYTTTFRATWGSGFIAAEKTMEYLQAKNKTLTIAYQPMQLAPDFVPIDTSTEPYRIDEKLQFTPYSQIDNPDYILQRITTSGKAYPKEVNGVKEKEIIGVSNNLFDNTLLLFVQGIHNKIIIYKAPTPTEKNTKKR